MSADKKDLLKALQSQIDEIMAAPSGSFGLDEPQVSSGSFDADEHRAPSVSSRSTEHQASSIPSCADGSRDASPCVDSLREEMSRIEANSSGGVSASFDCLTPEGRKAFIRLQDLCSYSEYSACKMRTRLVREEFSQDAASEAVDYAVALNLINDQRYAEALISTRLRAGKGQVAIERDLRSHEIDPSTVPGGPEVYWEQWGTEEDRAWEDVARHPSHSKNPSASSYRRLLSRGFSPSVAHRVVSQAYGL